MLGHSRRNARQERGLCPSGGRRATRNWPTFEPAPRFVLAPRRGLRHAPAQMSYALSFAPDFFARDDVDAVGSCERPTSVWEAIVSVQRDAWRDIARDVFGVAADRLTPEAVFARILQTNTCSGFLAPVEVWIDPQGDYTIRVYGPPEPPATE